MDTNGLKFANSFLIEAQRTPREETPQELGERMLRCLDAISLLHPAFRDWDFIRQSRDSDEMEEDNYREFLWPLEDARSRMTDLVVEWAAMLDDLGRIDPSWGYDILASNRTSERSQSVALNVCGGGLVNRTRSLPDAFFRTDMICETDPTIISYHVFKSVLIAIISCWELDSAKVFSSDLIDLWSLPRLSDMRDAIASSVR